VPIFWQSVEGYRFCEGQHFPFSPVDKWDIFTEPGNGLLFFSRLIWVTQEVNSQNTPGGLWSPLSILRN